MTLGARIAWDDTVLPFQLDRSNIRGRVARLDGVLDRILAQHDYPPAIESLVAEAALLTAMIGQAIKLRWRLSLQLRGTGAVKLVATDYYGPNAGGEQARMRAYANFDEEALNPASNAFAQIGEGYFGIVIDQGKGMSPYQGITPATGESLSCCAETYFAQSEQLPTRFASAHAWSEPSETEGGWRAGGVMLQHMPKGTLQAADSASGDGGLLSASDILDGDDRDNWNRANLLLDTLEELELVGPDVHPTDLLVRLFHEEEPRVFDAQSVIFGCTCSEERVRKSLSVYPASEIAEMTTEAGVVTADCQFCGAHYELDPRTLGIDAAVDAWRAD